MSTKVRPARGQGGEIVYFNPFRVKAFSEQPRKRFRGISTLAACIAEVDQTTPCVVTLLEGDPNFDAELVDGERRLRACREARMEVRCEVISVKDKFDRFKKSVAANMCKQDHDCIEIAHSIQRLFDGGCTMEQIMKILGHSITYVQQHQSLLKLHPHVQELLQTPADDEEGKRKVARKLKRKSILPFSIGLLLVPYDHGQQIKAADYIVSKNLSIAAARRYLARQDVILGRNSIVKRRGPREMFRTLSGQIDACADVFGTFTEMSDKDFQSVIYSVNGGERTDLTIRLQKCIDNLSELNQAIYRATHDKKEARAAS